MIVEACRLDGLRRSDVALVGSRHAAAATMAACLKRMIPEGARVVVASSGGGDSMALLALSLAMHDRRRPSVITPIVGHVDHALRSESAEEASFVEATCDRLGVACTTRRIDWATGTTRVTSEQAREARWTALEEIASEVDATAILTGHHADDQAETVLMRIARGTGIDGLAGIPECRRLASGRLIIRPLLGISRTALQQLLSEARLPFIEDPTNADTTRPRERLRHEVIPALEAIHPGAAAHLAALARECAGREPEPSGLTLDPDGRMQRGDCRLFDRDSLAGRLRATAAALTTADASSIPRATWLRAASMIQDDELRPRRLSIGETLELAVHATTTAIKASDGPPTPTATPHPSPGDHS